MLLIRDILNQIIIAKFDKVVKPGRSWTWLGS